MLGKYSKRSIKCSSKLKNARKFIILEITFAISEREQQQTVVREGAEDNNTTTQLHLTRGRLFS